MTAKYDAFMADLRELCKKHKVELYSTYDGAEICDAEDGFVSDYFLIDETKEE